MKGVCIKPTKGDAVLFWAMVSSSQPTFFELIIFFNAIITFMQYWPPVSAFFPIIILINDDVCRDLMGIQIPIAYMGDVKF